MSEIHCVLFAKCWSCQFGQCYEPPKWHTWADGEDIAHAKATGQPDPTKSRCGCPCAGPDPLTALACDAGVSSPQPDPLRREATPPGPLRRDGDARGPGGVSNFPS